MPNLMILSGKLQSLSAIAWEAKPRPRQDTPKQKQSWERLCLRVALFNSIAGLPTRQRRARKIELKARRAYWNNRCADEPRSFVPERRTLMKPEASHKEVALVSDAVCYQCSNALMQAAKVAFSRRNPTLWLCRCLEHTVFTMVQAHFKSKS